MCPITLRPLLADPAFAPHPRRRGKRSAASTRSSSRRTPFARRRGRRDRERSRPTARYAREVSGEVPRNRRRLGLALMLSGMSLGFAIVLESRTRTDDERLNGDSDVRGSGRNRGLGRQLSSHRPLEGRVPAPDSGQRKRCLQCTSKARIAAVPCS